MALSRKATSALKSAKRLLVAERKSQFDSFTIPPRRSYRQMRRDEKHWIIQFDRAIAKIEAVLEGEGL